MDSKGHKPEVINEEEKETVRVLHLAIAQMMVSMTDSEASIASLTENFSTISQHAEQMTHLSDTQSETLGEHAQIINQQAQQAIVGFQFHDKLTQRMNHVIALLQQIAVLLTDGERRDSIAEWTLLRQQLKSSYTMLEEHNVHDLIMQGFSVDETLNQLAQAEMENNIEFF